MPFSISNLFEDAGDLLFGSPPSVEYSQPSTLTPEQEAALAELIPFLQGQIGNPGSYGGNLSVDPSGAIGSSLASLEELAMQGANPDAFTRNIERGITQASRTGYNPTSFDQFYQTNVQAPLMEQFQQDILPSISRDFGGSNFFTSERAESENRARDDLLEALVAGRSSLAFQTEEAAKNRRLSALGLGVQRTGQKGAERSTTADILASILQGGIAETGIQERNIDRDFNAFLQDRLAGFEQIQQLLTSLGLTGRENIAAVLPGQTGLVQSFLSGAGQGFGEGAGSAIFGG